MKKTLIALFVLIAFTVSIPTVFACGLHGKAKSTTVEAVGGE